MTIDIGSRQAQVNIYEAAHGGEVSSGTTLDVRARYFFAMDPSDPWVTKLFAKSIMVRIMNMIWGRTWDMAVCMR